MTRTRGPTITPEIENLIGSVYREHPKWKAPKIRNEVEGILFERKEGFPRGWPGLSKVQKVLATIRKIDRNPKPEDKPWSIGTPSDYAIPPEALPAVLSVCKYARQAGNAFTIRQAKWAARLSGVLANQPPSDLWKWTVRYTGAECVSELINRPFDTTALDNQLMGLPSPQEGNPEYREWLARQEEKALSKMAARGESQITGEVSIPSKARKQKRDERKVKHERKHQKTRQA